MGEWVAFYLLAGVGVLAAVGVILSRRVVVSLAAAGLCLFVTAALFALLGANLSAYLQVSLATTFLLGAFVVVKRFRLGRVRPRTEILFAGVVSLLVVSLFGGFVLLRLAELSWLFPGETPPARWVGGRALWEVLQQDGIVWLATCGLMATAALLGAWRLLQTRFPS